MKFSGIVRKIPLVAMAALTVFAYGCGQAKFEKQNITSTNVASQYTKPKIDILLVQDSSSSMITPMSQVKSQLEAFLNGIDSKWDYHFTVVPLHKKLSLNSKYIVASDCSTITGGSCLNSSQKSYFNSPPAGAGPESGWINTIDQAAANTDYGFTKITENLSDSSMITTNFLRADAPLAVVVVSNGQDVSGITDYYEPFPGSGNWAPNVNSTSATTSFNTFKNFLNSTIKPGPGLTKFYAVVAEFDYLSSNCYGGNAWQGSRYMSMASLAAGGVGGAWYNLCSGGLSNVLSNIKAQLDTFIQAFIFNYAVIPDQPLVSSIVVKKNGAIVPQSSTNGWTYEGYKSNAFTAYLPYPTNRRSGYFIKMNGTAEYSGADVVTVDYQKP